MTKDGRYQYVWDAEGRLAEVRSRADLPVGAPLVKTTYHYDYIGRKWGVRYFSGVQNGGSITWSETRVRRYYYDGWSCIREVESDTNLLQNQCTYTYIWGRDLSETLQGAGGVGGLLGMIGSTGDRFHLIKTDEYEAPSTAADRMVLDPTSLGVSGEKYNIQWLEAALNALMNGMKLMANDSCRMRCSCKCNKIRVVLKEVSKPTLMSKVEDWLTSKFPGNVHANGKLGDSVCPIHSR